MSSEAMSQSAPWPQLLDDLVASVKYKSGWSLSLVDEPVNSQGVGGLRLYVTALVDNSLEPGKILVRHEFIVPAATYNRNTWMAWLFDRLGDVDTHERGEFFAVNGVRIFAPHHGNGEDPYRVWHVSDYATAAKRAGDD